MHVEDTLDTVCKAVFVEKLTLHEVRLGGGRGRETNCDRHSHADKITATTFNGINPPFMLAISGN